MQTTTTTRGKTAQVPPSQGVRNFLVSAGVLALGIAVGSAVSQNGESSWPARIVIENPVPPVLAIPHGGSVLVGASDSQYYIVTSTGRVEEIFVDNDELRWR